MEPLSIRDSPESPPKCEGLSPRRQVSAVYIGEGR